MFVGPVRASAAAAATATVFVSSTIQSKVLLLRKKLGLLLWLGACSFVIFQGRLPSCVSFPYPCTTGTTGRRSRTRSTMAASFATDMYSYLNAADAAALDRDLMTLPGFTLEQLMELAGLSVAEAVFHVTNTGIRNDNNVEGKHKTNDTSANGFGKILILCGPGNNGGDGLVAARHLQMFRYDVTVVYPPRVVGNKPPPNPHYANLVQQCRDLYIPILTDMPEDWADGYEAVVDAIFGFSFHGDPRPPYDEMIHNLKSLNGKNHVITIAVDVPSGWNVDGDDDDDDDRNGKSQDTLYMPDVLVSLTAPKLCAKKFTGGRHFVGGRFLPPALAHKYNVRLPTYTGVSQVVEITPKVQSQADRNGDQQWETSYAEYLAECSANVASVNQKEKVEYNVSDETWAAQYAAHCAKQEAACNKLEQK